MNQPVYTHEWCKYSRVLRIVIFSAIQYRANIADVKQKRPIYNVAHMVNGDSQVNLDWVNNANAIEADLAFSADGSPDKFYHGFPCDCGRRCSYESDPVSHFAIIRRKAQDKTKNFALFWIDLKLGSSGIKDFFLSGQKFAEVITRSGSLFPSGEEVPINVLLGAVSLDQKDFFRGFRQYILSNRPELLPKFGYDFSDPNIDINEILKTFEGLGIRENIWMGDGTANCLRPFRSDKRLKQIIAKRDSYDGTSLAPFKVYAWTVDKKSSMRDLLHLGVDAIIVNYPDRLQSVVKQEFHDSLFLATRETDPWKRLLASEVTPPLARGCSRAHCWRYTKPDVWCWTSTKCSSSSDCQGDIRCT